jgi:hypothetical protein
MQPLLLPPPVPSASVGGEVPGTVSGSSKMALIEKSDVKESIDVRGRCFYEYVALTFSFLGDVGWMLDGMFVYLPLL